MTCIPTRNPNQYWIPIVETNHIVMEPILSNQRLSMRCNAAILQNQGDCNVVLDNGFTIEPDQSYMFGNYSELNTIKIDMQVKFIDSTAPDPENPTRRLEVVEIISSMTGNGYYIDQPPITIKNPALNGVH